jgi:hypothetical protein
MRLRLSVSSVISVVVLAAHRLGAEPCDLDPGIRRYDRWMGQSEIIQL